jgi:hypothetical protein
MTFPNLIAATLQKVLKNFKRDQERTKFLIDR